MGIATNLGSFGVLAMVLDQPRRATRLLGAADARWAEMGGAPHPDDKKDLDDAITRVRAALCNDSFETQVVRRPGDVDGRGDRVRVE